MTCSNLLLQKLTSRDDANREDDSKYITVRIYEAIILMHCSIQEAGINFIKDIRASDAGKYALQLMDIIFTDEEMASSIYEESSKSKKPGLDRKRVAFLEGKITCLYQLIAHVLHLIIL